MKLGDRIVDGVFLERPNRYLAWVLVNGKRTAAHIPDPGRLPGLMIPQRRVRLIHRPAATRKTDYTLALVRHGRIWVSVYPVFANRLVARALEEGSLGILKGYKDFSEEVRQGKSRFDFRLDFPRQTAFLEVKSVSLVERGLGMFPDAPTERGRRHVEELIALRRQGFRAAVLFVSQRSDTRRITCNDLIDPAFGELLRRAREEGVEIYGYNCRVSRSAVALNRPVPVSL